MHRAPFKTLLLWQRWWAGTDFPTGGLRANPRMRVGETQVGDRRSRQSGPAPSGSLALGLTKESVKLIAPGPAGARTKLPEDSHFSRWLSSGVSGGDLGCPFLAL